MSSSGILFVVVLTIDVVDGLGIESVTFINIVLVELNDVLAPTGFWVVAIVTNDKQLMTKIVSSVDRNAKGNFQSLSIPHTHIYIYWWKGRYTKTSLEGGDIQRPLVRQTSKTCPR